MRQPPGLPTAYRFSRQGLLFPKGFHELAQCVLSPAAGQEPLAAACLDCQFRVLPLAADAEQDFSPADVAEPAQVHNAVYRSSLAGDFLDFPDSPKGVLT